INFAHGEFLALGGYIAYTLDPYLGFWWALIVSPFITAIIGLAVERVLIRPLYNRDPLYSLLLTFGLAYVLQDSIRFIGGAQGLPLHTPAVLDSPLCLTLFFVTRYAGFMVALVAFVVAVLVDVLKKTRVGMRIRAGTLDLEMVSALGVDVRILRNLIFGLGIFFAGLAGVLAGGMLGLTPTIGEGLIMPSFVAVIVGGL